MFIIQINDSNGILKDMVYFGIDRSVAEQHFLSACKQNVSNWNEYNAEDVETILDDGCIQFGDGAVNFINTDGYTSDNAIASIIGKFPVSRIIVTMTDGVEIESRMSREDVVGFRQDFRDTLELASKGKSTPVPIIISFDNGLFFQLEHMQCIIFETDDKSALKFTVRSEKS